MEVFLAVVGALLCQIMAVEVYSMCTVAVVLLPSSLWAYESVSNRLGIVLTSGTLTLITSNRATAHYSEDQMSPNKGNVLFISKESGALDIQPRTIIMWACCLEWIHSDSLIDKLLLYRRHCWFCSVCLCHRENSPNSSHSAPETRWVSNQCIEYFCSQIRCLLMLIWPHILRRWRDIYPMCMEPTNFKIKRIDRPFFGYKTNSKPCWL